MSAIEIDSIERLRDEIIGRRYGSVVILDAEASVGEDSSAERAVFLRLTLSDPDGTSWPVDEVYDMRQSVRAEARDLGIVEMVYFNLWPEHPAPLAPDVPTSGGE